MIGWHIPTDEEEAKVVEFTKNLIDPKIDRLEEMANTEVNIMEMKQILSALIGFQAGIVNCFEFDHGQSLPVPDGYESVITGDAPTTRIGHRPFLAEKIGYIPARLFSALQKVLKRLENDGNISDNRTLHWIFTTMSFCFNFKPRYTQNLLQHVDHYKRLYGLYRLQKYRKYPYAIFEVRAFNDLLVKRAFAYDYSYFRHGLLLIAPFFYKKSKSFLCDMS